MPVMLDFQWHFEARTCPFSQLALCQITRKSRERTPDYSLDS